MTRKAQVSKPKFRKGQVVVARINGRFIRTRNNNVLVEICFDGIWTTVLIPKESLERDE